MYLRRYWLALVWIVVISARVSSQEAEPKVLSIPDFAIPAEVNAAGIEGSMSILVSIDKTGTVKKANVLAGPAWPCGRDEPKAELSLVRKAVEEALLSAKFSPAMKKGNPDDAEVMITYAIGNAFRRPVPSQNANSEAGAKPAFVKAGVLNGKAIRLPEPDYPSSLRVSRIGGPVSVQVMFDEKGDVILAGALNGAKQLHESARTAACRAKFEPVAIGGTPVKVSGIITYMFSAH